MAYKQTPGRGNSPKTGNGLPSPLKQQTNPRTKEGYSNISSRSATNMDKEIEENKRRIMVETQAKSDSVSAAGTRKLSGGNKFQQGLQGNLAANRTRRAGGAGDMAVLRGKLVNSGGTTAEGNTVYTRQNKVEKNFTKLRQNKRTGEY